MRKAGLLKTTSTSAALAGRGLIALALLTGVLMTGACSSEKKPEKETKMRTVEVTVLRGPIQTTIVTTGSVEPQNRVELKPPIGGRVEELLVREGDPVKAGQVVAWLSSTERAALLDAARAKGEKELAYWREVYKATPLIAPIDGEVIVRKLEPGQSVGTDTPVIVLSDRLVVNARVDETDVGRVRTGQVVNIKLDAYPDTKATGRVDHVSYESKVVNNVTIYEVDVACDTIPDVFRSGMNSEVTIYAETRDNVLLLPDEAVLREKDGNFVTLPAPDGKEGERRRVEIGMADGKRVEITSGLAEGDKVTYRKKDFSISAVKMPDKNPFMPIPGKARSGGGRPPH